eukprot:gnl/TRDRNA2_/TRDRNA2_85623_c0_seq1.p1 gnl/TRDRNA2_/TRDRNA2_85623_c0~~gnl/TRDRNA2_/TRDRNA2_85623_c0_seq1.p1  ORF type:complete len:474 (-),score=75.02 gnl/TRDRNA2_/TRDRNA2_85623_c0_seq1:217-1638(-)
MNRFIFDGNMARVTVLFVLLSQPHAPSALHNCLSSEEAAGHCTAADDDNLSMLQVASRVSQRQAAISSNAASTASTSVEQQSQGTFKSLKSRVSEDDCHVQGHWNDAEGDVHFHAMGAQDNFSVGLHAHGLPSVSLSHNGTGKVQIDIGGARAAHAHEYGSALLLDQFGLLMNSSMATHRGKTLSTHLGKNHDLNARTAPCTHPLHMFLMLMQKEKAKLNDESKNKFWWMSDDQTKEQSQSSDGSNDLDQQLEAEVRAQKCPAERTPWWECAVTSSYGGSDYYAPGSVELANEYNKVPNAHFAANVHCRPLKGHDSCSPGLCGYMCECWEGVCGSEYMCQYNQHCCEHDIECAASILTSDCIMDTLGSWRACHAVTAPTSAAATTATNWTNIYEKWSSRASEFGAMAQAKVENLSDNTNWTEVAETVGDSVVRDVGHKAAELGEKAQDLWNRKPGTVLGAGAALGTAAVVLGF